MPFILDHFTEQVWVYLWQNILLDTKRMTNVVQNTERVYIDWNETRQLFKFGITFPSTNSLLLMYGWVCVDLVNIECLFISTMTYIEVWENSRKELV